MAYKYRHFIPQNTAPIGAKRIGVYKGNEKVFTIPLGRLTPPNGNKLYSFGLVSDLHIWKVESSWQGNKKFDNVLTYFESRGCLFCAHCGDITQTGLYDDGDKLNLAPAQFEMYKSICDKHTIPVYGICGNHESYVNPIENNLTELKYYAGTDLYYTIEQNNDLFIFIGQPHGSIVMSNSAFSWLEGMLETNKNKRCFVFVHAYIEEDSGDPMDVRENSIFEYWGEANKNAFMNLLRQYPNTILFHGHSHMKFECQKLDKTANYTERNGFKSVHVPSCATPRDVDVNNKVSVDDHTASQGYIVDVYDDCIVLNGMDFVNEVPVPLGIYKIGTSSQTAILGTARLGIMKLGG